ncbi:MAG TPA: hypothetical protein VF865_19135, partial [Acidobacteriaceae bacterium]
IEHATGISFTEIPLLPEDIFEKMTTQETKAGVPHPSQSHRDGWDVKRPASGGSEDLNPATNLDTRTETEVPA